MSKNIWGKYAKIDDAYTRYTQRFQNGRTHGAGKVAIKSHLENFCKIKWIISPLQLISDYFVILKQMWLSKTSGINRFCIFYHFLSATAWHFPEIAALCESVFFYIMLFSFNWSVLKIFAYWMDIMLIKYLLSMILIMINLF